VNKTAETVPASDRRGDGDNVRRGFGAGHRRRPKSQASMRFGSAQAAGRGVGAWGGRGSTGPSGD